MQALLWFYIGNPVSLLKLPVTLYEHVSISRMYQLSRKVGYFITISSFLKMN